MKNIFVSSTFVDFQEERDVLRNSVLPALNAIGREAGEEYGFIDLRWGVNTLDMNEEESNREVLSVCLSEIDRCCPYMIVMLGERYGYTPNIKIVHQILASHDKEVASTIKYPDYDISVTELEILYRIHKEKGNLDNVWFFFRESKGDREYADLEDLAKMDALKAMILKVAPERVKIYKKTALDESWKDAFRNIVTTTISDRLAEEQQQMLQRKDELNRQHGEFFENSCYTPYTHYLEYKRQLAIWKRIIDDTAVIREKVFNKVVRNIQYKTRLLLVRGPVGCGKTAFLASVGAWISHVTDYQVYFISCMSSNELSYGKGVIDYIQAYLDRSKPSDKWLFIIDGIEKFKPIENAQLLDKMQSLCESDHIRVIVGAENSFFSPLDIKSNTLEILDPNDIEIVIKCILEKMGKSLSPDVREALVSRSNSQLYEESVNPLRLEMAITELTLMGEADYKKIRQLGDGMHAIRDYQLSKIQTMPYDIEKMFLHLIECVCEVSFAKAWDVVCLLALSSKGLSERDLINIFEMRGEVLTPLQISQLINFLPSFFMYREDGRIDFTHMCSRRAFLQQMKENASISRYAMELVNYCDGLSKKDALKEEIWELLLHAEAGESFFERVLEAGRYERLLAAIHMMHWLLDFKNPEEAGYLGIKDDWKYSMEYRFLYPPADDPMEQSFRLALSCIRPASCDRSLLDSALQKRVDFLVQTIEKILHGPYEQNRIQSILRFFGYELPIAYRFETYEGRENSKRALSTLYMSVLGQEHLQRILQENESLHRNYVDATRFVCEVLLSTGFYKDKDVALEMIYNVKNIIPSSEKIDVRFALAQLKKVEGDACLRWEEPEKYRVARGLYAQSHNELHNLLELMKIGGFDGKSLRIDENSLVLYKCKALFELAELLWEEGGNENKSRAHELFLQMYDMTEQHRKAYVKTDIEKQVVIGENAYMCSKLYLALAIACDNEFAYTERELKQKKWQALNWASKGMKAAKEVLLLRGQTVTAVEQYYRSYLEYAQIMYKIDVKQYIEINENYLYREINKWRRFVGCRESLLLEADYFMMCIDCDDLKDNSALAEAKKRDYLSRVNILRQQIEYADPMINHLKFN